MRAYNLTSVSAHAVRLAAADGLENAAIERYLRRTRSRARARARVGRTALELVLGVAVLGLLVAWWVSAR